MYFGLKSSPCIGTLVPKYILFGYMDPFLGKPLQHDLTVGGRPSAWWSFGTLVNVLYGATEVPFRK